MSRRCPGHRVRARAEPRPQFTAAAVEEAHGPGRSRQLADRPPGHAFGDALRLPIEFVGPGRCLQPEGDGRAGLAVRATCHHRVAIEGGQVDACMAARDHVCLDESPDVPHDHPEPRIGEVLNGDAQVHVFTRCLREYRLECLDQAERRMRGLPGPRGDGFGIQ